MKEALFILEDIIHNLQKERSCASMLSSSHGHIFNNELTTQFKESDQSLKSFRESLDRWKESGTLKLSQLEYLYSLCRDLPDFRQSIQSLEIDALQIVNHYSNRLIGPLLQLMIEITLLMDEHNPTLVSAYNAFIQWKERVALGRAIGARGFIKHNFHDIEFLKCVLFLLSEQNNYQNTFMALANTEQKELIQNVLDQPEHIQLEQLHTLLKEKHHPKEIYELSPEKWFSLVTAKTNGLRSVEKKIIDTLSDSTPHHAKPKRDITPHVSASPFCEHIDLINSLQIFLGIYEKDINRLLQHAQVREFQKGKPLFLEGEQANRLYIVLKGWVKIFKGTASGEETTLQMLTSGDAIMESAVFLNTSFPVSGQIAENATLLTFPTPTIRNQLKNNHDFALNLLASMSYRSQGLIRQIEYDRLKTVDERVGWFLLKLMPEQGLISREVKLPYDKSLIASYLNMKRETFSRSLKRLKEKGFIIESDSIVFPEFETLCNFCDEETAHLCPSKKGNHCLGTSSLRAGVVERPIYPLERKGEPFYKIYPI